MPAQPPILAPDPATGRVYVVTRYRTVNGAFTALERTDVTESFQAVLEWLADTGRLHLRRGR